MNLKSRLNQLERLQGGGGPTIESIAPRVLAAGRWLEEVRDRGQTAEQALAGGDVPLPAGLDEEDVQLLFQADRELDEWHAARPLVDEKGQGKASFSQPIHRVARRRVEGITMFDEPANNFERGEGT